MMDGGMNGCWDRNMAKRFDGLLRNQFLTIANRCNAVVFFFRVVMSFCQYVFYETDAMALGILEWRLVCFYGVFSISNLEMFLVMQFLSH